MNESEGKNCGDCVIWQCCKRCSLNVRPTAGAPRVLVKLRRGWRGKIAFPTSGQLNSDRTIALHHMGKEWAVIQQAIAGNADAQEHLFTRQTSRLYRTAFALLRNKEDAEDAVQEGLCKAYTSLRSFRGSVVIFYVAYTHRHKLGSHGSSPQEKCSSWKLPWTRFWTVSQNGCRTDSSMRGPTPKRSAQRRRSTH